MKLPGVYRIGLNESQYMVTALRSKYNFRKLKSQQWRKRTSCVLKAITNVSSHEWDSLVAAISMKWRAGSGIEWVGRAASSHVNIELTTIESVGCVFALRYQQAGLSESAVHQISQLNASCDSPSSQSQIISCNQTRPTERRVCMGGGWLVDHLSRHSESSSLCNPHAHKRISSIHTKYKWMHIVVG